MRVLFGQSSGLLASTTATLDDKISKSTSGEFSSGFPILSFSTAFLSSLGMQCSDFRGVCTDTEGVVGFGGRCSAAEFPTALGDVPITGGMDTKAGGLDSGAVLEA